MEDSSKIMTDRIKVLIKEKKLSWAKLAELEGMPISTRGSLKIKVERWAEELNRFVGHFGYEVVFRKKQE